MLVKDTIFEVVQPQQNIAIGSADSRISDSGIAPAIGSAVTICIRPYALSLDSNDLDKIKINQIKAEVVKSRYFGEFREYKLKIDDGRFLTAITSSSVQAQVNSKVIVSIPISQCLILT